MPTWLHIPGCLALGEWSHHRDYLGREDLFCTVLLCILATSSNIFCFHTISVLYWAHLCMKCCLGISNFLEEISAAAAAAKSLQSCPTPCDPIDGSPPGSPVPRPWDSPGKNTGVGCHFLLQCMKVKSLSHVRPFVTPWTATCQAPPSMGFSRQEYWSGVPLPSPNNDH